MNTCEASEAIYVRGCIPGANRYYIVSAWLRDSGWSGAGDIWREPTPIGDTTFSFDMAAYLMGFDKGYAYCRLRESWQRQMEQIRATVIPAFGQLQQQITKLVDSPEWRRLRETMSCHDEDVDDLSEYEWAWVMWAEETDELENVNSDTSITSELDAVYTGHERTEEEQMFLDFGVRQMRERMDRFAERNQRGRMQ